MSNRSFIPNLIPRTMAVALVACALAGCYRDTSNLTASGRGRPQVTVGFPAKVAAGSTHTASIHIENPGPGNIETIVVSFSFLGSPREGIEDALVVPGKGTKSPSVVGVDPKPEGVSQGGTIFRFGGLDVGESMDVRFRLEVPGTRGEVANSLLVYDGTEVRRAMGTRLETTIR